MIHYALRCEAGHEFDGWFKDSATFEKTAARGLIECPFCASTKVSRALMAPAIATGRREEPASEAAAAPTPVLPGKAVGGPIPPALYAALARLRAEIERTCEYVGPAFAEEARRIHVGAAERRGIYGEATPEEAEALREDGIEVQSIPWVPRTDG
ncbi:MAG: DUF1178 family protein [Elioraea sp.]|nr:DUF1178 family protein [Elioraea sp.]MDW8444278.1 DUF1178 family protein [Acetobacteraceae bacterium]